MLDRNLLPYLGTAPLSKLGAADLDRLHRRLREAGGRGGPLLNAGTLQQLRDILKTGLKFVQQALHPRPAGHRLLEQSEGSLFQPRGIILNKDIGKVVPVDPSKIAEYITHSYLHRAASRGRGPGRPARAGRRVGRWRGSRLGDHHRRRRPAAGLPAPDVRHQIGLPEVLAAAELGGHPPARVAAVGMIPVDLETGYGISAEAADQLDCMVDHAVAILAAWGLGCA